MRTAPDPGPAPICFLNAFEGEYEFVISNKADKDKLVGFWLQDGKTHDFLDKFPLKPGETRTIIATINENGFRYRCPINPTPWYDVGVSNKS